MRKIGFLGMALAALVFVSGCGQQLKQENEQLKAQVTSLTEEKNNLQNQVASIQKELEDAKTQVTNATAELDAVKKELEAEKAKKPVGGKKKK